MDDELDRTLDAVGPRLKRLRLRRDITLTDLAEETGISASTLSRLEAGLRRPTLEQLLPLARAYGVTLDELVDAPPTGDPRINLRPVACEDEALGDDRVGEHDVVPAPVFLVLSARFAEESVGLVEATGARGQPAVVPRDLGEPRPALRGARHS